LEIRHAEIVVIGGGPGGLSAARAASESGASPVVLLEKSPEIGSPVRTTGGTFIEDMLRLEIPASLWHPIHRIRFVSPNNSVFFDFAKPATCVLDVHGTLRFLASRAVREGVKIHVNTTANRLVTEGGAVKGVAAKIRNREPVEFRSNVVIDASGYRGQFLKESGTSAGITRFGVGSEYDMYSPTCNQDEAVLIVGDQVAPSGYAWIFPWGNGRVRVGVGIIHPDSDSQPDFYLDNLIRRAADFQVDLSQAEPLEHHEGLFPSGGLIPSFVGDGIMGVGDSAGQGSTLVGEGIRWAIDAGELAGRAAAKAVRSGDCSSRGLAPYQEEFEARYRRNLRIAYEVNRRRAKWDDATWDRKVDRLRSMTPEHFAGALRGNFEAKWIARLAWSQLGGWIGKAFR